MLQGPHQRAAVVGFPVSEDSDRTKFLLQEGPHLLMTLSGVFPTGLYLVNVVNLAHSPLKPSLQ